MWRSPSKPVYNGLNLHQLTLPRYPKSTVPGEGDVPDEEGDSEFDEGGYNEEESTDQGS